MDYAAPMLPAPALRCPYCNEPAELWVEPDVEGEMTEDCPVCCKPWRVQVQRDDFGEAIITLRRS